MIQTSKAPGFAPACVAFDNWYGSLANLEQVRDCGWTWLTQFKANRLVNPDDSGNQRLDEIDLGVGERIVHLKGYGFVKIFKIVPPDGDIEYWASNDLSMNSLRRVQYAGFANNIEQYHRGIKQFCGVERCQTRRAKAQRHHIELSLRAFLRLESYCFHAGISWFEAKTQIAREAVRAYIAYPLYHLVRTA